MSHRTAIRGVLHGFLGTYMSRYSDYGGYWLFGFLDKSTPLTIDLLHPHDQGTDPKAFAVQLAVTKFTEQLQKAGLEASMVREASLTLSTTGHAGTAAVNGQSKPAHELAFAVSVTMDNGRQFVHNDSMLVATHDPKVELRREGQRGA